MKLLLVLAASASIALAASPTTAQQHHGYRHHDRECAIWRHGHCARWMNHGYTVSTARHGRYRVGYVFGPSYGYTAYGALPQPYVIRYHLSPNYRYVYTGNTIYVVDPTTYAVTRILNAIGH